MDHQFSVWKGKRKLLAGRIFWGGGGGQIFVANLFAITDFDAFVAKTAFFVIFDGCVMVGGCGIHQGKSR